ncbi:MAG: hypothetical protein ACR2O2_04995 [Ruegeria sp.]
MVTKAELEAQVADLRRQLDDKPKPEKEIGETSQSKESQTINSSIGSGDSEHERNISKAIEELSGEFEQVLADLDSLPHKKSILFALGVFTLGYMIGRSK